MARRLGAAPSSLSFGDSVARLALDAMEFILLHSAFCIQLVRLPGVAPGHAPWLGAILAVKSQPRKSKGPGVASAWWPSARTSRPMPFQQRTNTSCYLAIPTHGFTVVLSVFRGTPPAKPLDCKIRLKSSGAHRWRPARIRAGGELRLSRAASCFLPGDIF